MKKIGWIVVVLVLLAGGYFWWSSQQAGTNGPLNQGSAGQPNNGQVQQPSTAAQGDGTSVSQNLALGLTTSAKLGQYLIAYNGMTVYTYSKDSVGKSTCTGACAQKWPPYRVPVGSALNLQAGITGTIGTIVRTDDGTTQVTYKGMPLYFYAGDKASGDTNGEGVGGVWYVVKP